ncbi:MAG TPA: hypothetical protein VHU19_07180 [Pyrinomonadaceae bacterium]|nr:hypothetical protein [Pyrinomonadaceae bacterium]
MNNSLVAREGRFDLAFSGLGEVSLPFKGARQELFGTTPENAKAAGADL